MIRLYIITAIILRYVRVYLHDINRIFAALFWPAFDMFLWGFLGAWISHNSDAHFQITFLSSIALWQLMLRLSQEMPNSFLEEVWSQNVVNFFVAPIKIIEWLFALITVSISVSLVVYLNCILVIILLYKESFLVLLHNFLIFGPALVLAGIFLGMIPLILIMKFGRKGAEIAYIITWIVAPFCGVFYPREILPLWAQKIGSFLPMTYAFESLRLYRNEGIFFANNLIISCTMSMIYIFLLFFVFMYVFEKTKERGLSKLYD